MKNLFEPGQPVESKIVAIGNDTVFIDLGLKSEGLVNLSEFTDDEGKYTIKEGDPIKVFFRDAQGDELHFTTRLGGKTGRNGGAESSMANTMIESAFKNEMPVGGHVEKEIKGGFEVTVAGSRAFCPYSQMGYKQKEEPAYYIGRTLTFKIQEYKNDGRNIVVSNRAIGEEAEADNLAKVSASIKEGMTVHGKVVSLQKYGAFVDIGGFEALLPISEISHTRVEDVASVLKVGQELDAKVIKADWAHNRVSLSTKELESDPWDTVAKQFPAGTKISGTIARVADFGVFVTIAPGIDGLVHISTLENIDRNTNIRKLFKTGDRIDVSVIKVDSKERRISLQPASSAEQDDTASKYLSNQDNDDDGYNPFAALLKK